MKWILTIAICLLLIVPSVSAVTNWTYSTPGTYYWTCPTTNTTNITVLRMSAGGGSGASGGTIGSTAYHGEGGSSGDTFVSTGMSFTPGTNYTIVVGSGGANATAGTHTSNGGTQTSAFSHVLTGGAGGTISAGYAAGGAGEYGIMIGGNAIAGGTVGASAGGAAGSGYGAGGGGGGAATTPIYGLGGKGSDGIVMISDVVNDTFDSNIPDFSADITTSIPGTLVSFTDESIIINSTLLTYDWDFGDGMTSTEVNPKHVFEYLGSYDISLTLTNFGSGSVTQTKVSYIVMINREGTTVFYSPKQSVFKVVDKNNNPVIGANVSANFNQSTLPTTELNWLVSNYGMNIQAANEAMNGTLVMSGITDSTGAITFTMQNALGYDVNVISGGSTYYFMINSLDNYYILHITSGGYTPPQDVNNTYSGISNSTLTFSQPNSSYMTMGVDYLDTTGYTDNLIFTIKLVNNNTIMYTTSQAVTGATRVLINKTYPNVRGDRWIWYYDAHRTV